ncbi:MAG: hypothetical protein JXR53_10645 [Bacteroidales bacterium]|nr:hypothetical protein [Bacteroidales bacterium]
MKHLVFLFIISICCNLNSKCQGFDIKMIDSTDVLVIENTNQIIGKIDHLTKFRFIGEFKGDSYIQSLTKTLIGNIVCLYKYDSINNLFIFESCLFCPEFLSYKNQCQVILNQQSKVANLLLDISKKIYSLGYINVDFMNTAISTNNTSYSDGNILYVFNNDSMSERYRITKPNHVVYSPRFSLCQSVLGYLSTPLKKYSIKEDHYCNIVFLELESGSEKSFTIEKSISDISISIDLKHLLLIGEHDQYRNKIYTATFGANSIELIGYAYDAFYW